MQYSWASLVAQLVKNPPAMQETWVQSLGWKDPLEKGNTTHSSMLAWRIQGLYRQWGGKESDTTERLSLSLHIDHRNVTENEPSPTSQWKCSSIIMSSAAENVVKWGRLPSSFW